jgi:hypothetical protein
MGRTCAKYIYPVCWALTILDHTLVRIPSMFRMDPIASDITSICMHSLRSRRVGARVHSLFVGAHGVWAVWVPRGNPVFFRKMDCITCPSYMRGPWAFALCVAPNRRGT